jgi:NTE family protein
MLGRIGTSRALAVLAGAWFALAAPSRAAEEPSPPAARPERPRIGLVLSGGGARGLAHVGVLKVLERERVPVDLVVGTSMGAIIGGLYASGMRADEIERELLAVRWDEVFAPRVGRPELSQRRKEQDFELSPVLELGYRDGELRAPQAAVSSRGLESLLRRYTLPVRTVTQFDRLPIPFRAVATDMESGRPVELAEGDLASALRSSMSVPGVFPPIELGGRVLGDGGLVDNLPVAIARRMGADVVIAVNVGTPLAGRDTLSSIVGLTAQMINILTEQNVQRSLALLAPDDLLITPALGTLGSGDFERTRDLVALGRQAAEAARARLARHAVAPERYATWREGRAPPPATPVTLDVVAFEGTTATAPERLAAQLESQPGRPFDVGRAERDVRRLAASGDYLRADFRIVDSPVGQGLVFDLDDKPWGPNFLRLGLDLATDFAGRSSFNLKLAHDRRWLTRNGTEWRNRVNLGSSPLVASELYHPLNWTATLANDWFVALWGLAERRRLSLFDDRGDETAIFDRLLGRTGVDLGQPWAEFGEVRFGLVHATQRTRPRVLGTSYTGARDTERWHENGVRARVVIDQLDYAIFPLAGYRFEAEASAARRRGDTAGVANRLQGSATGVLTRGRHTFNLHALAGVTNESDVTPLVGRYALGGFHFLSGYEPGQITGNHIAFARLTWYMRLNREVVLTRGFFLGATLEAGNAWLRRPDISLADLKSGYSVFVGADTGIGPMYLGLTNAPGGSAGITFFIGRP